MNGFLHRLIDRAAQRTPVLTRRRRALFEPAASQATLDRTVGNAPDVASVVGASGQRAATDGATVRPDVPDVASIGGISGEGAAPDEAAVQPAVFGTRRLAQEHTGTGAPELADPDPPHRHASLRTELRQSTDAVLPAATHRAPDEQVAIGMQRDSMKSDSPPKGASPVGASTSIEEAHAKVIPTPPLQRTDSLWADEAPAVPSRFRQLLEADRVRGSSEATALGARAGQTVTQRADVSLVTSAIARFDESENAASRLRAQATPKITQAVQLVKASQSMTDSGSSAAAISDSASVQVTIGRVEVRAAMPPTPSSTRPKHVSPRLTLDDYLRGRNRGTR